MKAIFCRYIGPTNTRGARIVATAEGGDKPHKVYFPYQHQLQRDDVYKEAARALCNKMGWKGTLIEGWTEHGAVYVFDTGDRVEVA